MKLISKLSFLLILSLFIVIPQVDFVPLKNPTVSGKFVVFLFVIELSILLFLIGNILENRVISISLIDAIFFGLLSLIVFNRYFNQPIYSFSIRFIELIGLYMVYLIFRSYKNESLFYVLFFGAIIGANLQIIIGFIQLYGFIKSNHQFLKSTGSFFNSGPFAGYLISVFSVSLFYIKNQQAIFSKITNGGSSSLTNSKIILRWLVLFNILGCISLLPILKSRASFISVLCILILVYRKEISLTVRKIINDKILKYTAIIFLLMVMATGSFALLAIKKESSKGRFLILKVTSMMISDNPIFGLGFDRFRANYMDYQAEYFKERVNKEESVVADNTIYAFNEPLQFLTENGIIGVAGALILLFVLIKRADKKNDLFWLACAGLISIFAFSFFSYPSEILPIKIMIFLFLSILANLDQGKKLNIKFPGMYLFAHKVSKISFLITLTLGIITCFGATMKMANFFFRWENASIKYYNNDFEKAKFEYGRLYSGGKKNGDFLAEYGKILFFNHDYSTAITVLKQAKLHINNAILETTLGDCQYSIRDYDNAEKSYLTACFMKPNSFYSKYLLLNLYKKSNQMNKGVKVAKEILGLNVKVRSEATDEIKNDARIFLQKTDK